MALVARKKTTGPTLKVSAPAVTPVADVGLAPRLTALPIWTKSGVTSTADSVVFLGASGVAEVAVVRKTPGVGVIGEGAALVRAPRCLP